MRHHFDRITQHIIAEIEQGASEYRLPWHKEGTALAQPINAVTGKAYRGLNILGLWMASSANDFRTGRWASYRQWSAAGAQVRKGEKGTPIFFWQAPDRSMDDSTDGDRRMRGFVARTFVVFNQDQVDGGVPEAAQEARAIAPAVDDHYFDAVAAKVTHGGDRAFYSPALDTIHLPEPRQFHSQEAYFSVRAHETVHWTGAKHRLDRDLTGRFGNEAYAMEELVAELGAAFLCSLAGISQQPRSDHAAYIATWLRVMRGDNKAILTAASQAQRAVDYIVEQRGAYRRTREQRTIESNPYLKLT